jgi:hypothetical protein
VKLEVSGLADMPCFAGMKIKIKEPKLVFQN